MFLYPIRDDIPIMLIDEAIPLDPSLVKPAAKPTSEQHEAGT